MSKVDWSKAPEGATHHVSGTAPNWYRVVAGESGYYYMDVDMKWCKSLNTDLYKAHGNYSTITPRQEFQPFTSIEDAQPAPDMVNHPPHYQSDNGIECIDAIRAALGRDGFIAYAKGNVIKYLWREKADKLEDMRKAAWYLNRAIEEQLK
ncbi:MAG: DUF3310 domain-containing protein [Shewanella sp.]